MVVLFVLYGICCQQGVSGSAVCGSHIAFALYCQQADENVYKKIKGFFGTAEQFWAFHNLPDSSNKLLFIDIKEEEFDQMKEIAVEILKSMSQQYKESMKEILEYSAMRNEFDRKIKTALNISQCMVENIRKQVLEEIY